MRKVVLFIAMSLDGFIADRRGGVDWLSGQGSGASFDAYGAFIQNVDTVLMGWNTYHQIITELASGEWPYTGLACYVFTHRVQPASSGVIFIQEDPCALVRRLQQEQGKDVWICGGAQLVQQLMAQDLIDEYYISVIPTLLGGGVRLFGPLEQERKLCLLETHSCDGITGLVYVRR